MNRLGGEILGKVYKVPNSRTWALDRLWIGALPQRRFPRFWLGETPKFWRQRNALWIMVAEVRRSWRVLLLVLVFGVCAVFLCLTFASGRGFAVGTAAVCQRVNAGRRVVGFRVGEDGGEFGPEEFGDFVSRTEHGRADSSWSHGQLHSNMEYIHPGGEQRRPVSTESGGLLLKTNFNCSGDSDLVCRVTRTEGHKPGVKGLGRPAPFGRSGLRNGYFYLVRLLNSICDWMSSFTSLNLMN